LDFEKAWRAFKTRGPKIAFLGLMSAAVLALANEIAKHAVSDVADEAWYRFFPPKFVIAFTIPIERGELILRDNKDEEITRKTWSGRIRAIDIHMRRGYYGLELHRSDQRVLQTGIPLWEPAKPVEVETAETKWAALPGVPPIAGENTGKAPELIETRSSATTSDRETSRLVNDTQLRAILDIAVEQIGVNEKTSKDQETIANYWTATAHVPYAGAPWGGAFLSWVIREAGAKPDNRSPGFTSWLQWGEEVAAGDAKPGMITIFSFPGLPRAPSNMLVGIFLRRQPKCIEVIAGNIQDMVVVTCVSARLISVRRPKSV
jgi:hypothetical protein